MSVSPSSSHNYSIAQIISMFVVPAVAGYILIYFVRPILENMGLPPTYAFYSAVSILMIGLILAALIIVRREGYALSRSALRQRMYLEWPHGWKEWALAFVIGVGSFIVSLIVGGYLNPLLAQVPGFQPPPWYPASLNPTAKIDPLNPLPDVSLAGNWLFFGFILLILVVNILGEELYFRGTILPKMGVFGQWDWIVNGTLFTLYHVFQRWLYFGILPGALGLAFIVRRCRSLYIAMLGHFAGNFIGTVIGILPLILDVRR